jgi:hypothetical protein
MFGTKLELLQILQWIVYVQKRHKVFCQFLNVQKSGRMKVPWCIAQTGKRLGMKLLPQFILECVN